jgi:hypothetical protein
MGWPGMRNVMPGKAHAPMENPGGHSFVSALNFRNWGSDEALPSKNYVFEGLASSGLHYWRIGIWFPHYGTNDCTEISLRSKS